MNNKSNAIALSAAAFVALVAIAGVSFYTYAAGSNTNTVGQGRQMGKNLTTEDRAVLDKEWQAKDAERQTLMLAVQTALKNKDYNAWVTAVKAIDEDAPILAKITEDNFSKLTEANGYMEKARTIMEELGVQGEGMMGMGKGRGFGPGRHGGNCSGDCTAHNPDNTPATNNTQAN